VTLVEIQTFKDLYRPHTCLLGMDIGRKTIGLALSDHRWQVASPLTVLKRGKLSQDIEILNNVIHKHAVCGLVLGLPLNMDGSRGPMAQAVHDYAIALLKFLDLPIAFWDERLTTVMAERVLLAADLSRQKRRQVVDKMAAALILQGFLDRLNRIENPL
jgi:putative Holliday junction resolvase